MTIRPVNVPSFGAKFVDNEKLRFLMQDSCINEDTKKWTDAILELPDVNLEVTDYRYYCTNCDCGNDIFIPVNCLDVCIQNTRTGKKVCLHNSAMNPALLFNRFLFRVANHVNKKFFTEARDPYNKEDLLKKMTGK